jgi:hypothetical protein
MHQKGLDFEDHNDIDLSLKLRAINKKIKKHPLLQVFVFRFLSIYTNTRERAGEEQMKLDHVVRRAEISMIFL